jgi:hypothetical protein
MHDRRQRWLAAELIPTRHAPVVRIERISRRGQSASVPCPCQNGRKTAVASGHSRTSRTASDLGMGWLTRCVKHTSKQRVTCTSSPALRCRVEPYFDWTRTRKLINCGTRVWYVIVLQAAVIIGREGPCLRQVSARHLSSSSGSTSRAGPPRGQVGIRRRWKADHPGRGGPHDRDVRARRMAVGA